MRSNARRPTVGPAVSGRRRLAADRTDRARGRCARLRPDREGDRSGCHRGDEPDACRASDVRAGTPRTPRPADQRMPNGSVIKCMAVYDEPFWRERGLSGQVTSDRGPVKVVFDNSPPGGRPGVCLALLEGDWARRLGGWEPADRQRAAVGCFARFFGDRASSPVEYVEKDWSAEEWTRGCHGAFLPPHTWPASATLYAHRWGHCTGPVRKQRPNGWVTWTARSNPATAPHPRSSASSGEW